MFGLCVFYQQHEEKSFLSWMRETNQLFTGDEYQTRFGIWMSNKRLVQEHNSANTFQVSMNKFASMTQAEYKSILGFKANAKGVRGVASRRANAAQVDWRDSGIVNDVKDQSSCGSCWAFSAVQAAESGWAQKSGKLLSFSEQNLVDCDTSSSGCNGGLMTSAYTYIIGKQSGMFMLEEDYPYTAEAGTCKYDASKGYGKLVSYVEIDGTETDLAAKVSTGVVAIAIDASHWSFQLYSSGIYDESKCSSLNLDHGVGCVGYGTESGVAYWIVRNSWGTSWGENGYIRMVKDKNNQCGEATMACQPRF